jgi:hypothetical protein
MGRARRGQPAFLGMFGHTLRREQQLGALLGHERLRLEPSQANGERVQIDTERFAPETSSFDQHGATAAKGIGHAAARRRQIADQVSRGDGVQARRVAMKPVYVVAHALLGIDREAAPHDLDQLARTFEPLDAPPDV